MGVRFGSFVEFFTQVKKQCWEHVLKQIITNFTIYFRVLKIFFKKFKIILFKINIFLLFFIFLM